MNMNGNDIVSILLILGCFYIFYKITVLQEKQLKDDWDRLTREEQIAIKYTQSGFGKRSVPNYFKIKD